MPNNLNVTDKSLDSHEYSILFNEAQKEIYKLQKFVDSEECLKEWYEKLASLLSEYHLFQNDRYKKDLSIKAVFNTKTHHFTVMAEPKCSTRNCYGSFINTTLKDIEEIFGETHEFQRIDDINIVRFMYKNIPLTIEYELSEKEIKDMVSNLYGWK